MPCIKEIYETATQVIIVSKYFKSVDLTDYLSHSTKLLPISDSLKIILGIMKALVNMHQAGLIHRDVKPENILIEESE